MAIFKLGNHDSGVSKSQIQQYLQRVKKVTRVDWGKQLKMEGNGNWVNFAPNPLETTMSIKEAQTILKQAGFFPHGEPDGLVGYSTLSALRLFQEYVRTVDKVENFYPDGLIGIGTIGKLQEWKGKEADWVPVRAQWAEWVKNGNAVPESETGEYAQWLRFLEDTKDHYQEHPGSIQKKVNKAAEKEGIDTRKVSDWDFSPSHVHLIGIRRQASGRSQLFNDVMILLINGMVFKFLGSTDPGKTKNRGGFPFLVPGQHNYHIGWHLIGQSVRDRQKAKAYLALKPHHVGKNQGVKVVRTIPPQMKAQFADPNWRNTPIRRRPKLVFDANNFDLNGELEKHRLETNNSINVHWAGIGVDAKNPNSALEVRGFSEGCQVIAGAGYLNHHNQLQDCTAFAASGSGALGTKEKNIRQTMGAYNMLLDLVATFSNDPKGILRYTLLSESDLGRNEDIKKIVDGALTKAGGSIRG